MGAVAGFIAGLFGVGGGVIIVPTLVYAYTQQGMSVAILTYMAVGTSLAVICVSSISSVITHHKNGFVCWRVFKRMAPGLILGAMLGVYTVIHIPGPTLQWIIGGYLLFVSLQMGFEIMPSGERQLPDTKGLFFAGSIVGWVSAMFGIGGGSLNVPFLSYYGMRMQNAVATAAACGMPIAMAGVVSNIVAGQQAQILPEWSLGYIYLPAFFGIAFFSMPFAKLGAKWAKKISGIILKRLFAIFLAIIGISLIVTSVGNS